MNTSSDVVCALPQRDSVVLPIVGPGPQPRAASAVSWAAIFAGAAGAAALSLSLLTLGVGFGMATISPWSPGTLSAAELGASSIVWITLTSILASALGGYLAGRLRTRWAGAQADEVYFRDTAHGFLTWALATLATATLMATVVGAIVSNGVQAGATVIGATTAVVASDALASGRDAEQSSVGYFVDVMFRPELSYAPEDLSEGALAERTLAVDAEEARGIFNHMLYSAPASSADVSHLSHVVSRRTGLSAEAALTRVNETYARALAAIESVELRAKEAADKARKNTAYGSLWLFIALLAGAFFASLAATFGGRQRDL